MYGSNFYESDITYFNVHIFHSEYRQWLEFFDQLPTSSCPRSFWMTPNYDSANFSRNCVRWNFFETIWWIQYYRKLIKVQKIPTNTLIVIVHNIKGVGHNSSKNIQDFSFRWKVVPYVVFQNSKKGQKGFQPFRVFNDFSSMGHEVFKVALRPIR